MEADEWSEFASYLGPLIKKQECSKFSEETALAETEKVLAKLRESYMKTSERFRCPNGKFKYVCSRIKKRLEKDPCEDIYKTLQLFKSKLKSYRPISTEAADKRNRRNVQKLDAHIDKLNKQIRKLEERELDLNDMDSDVSSYIHLDKLKKEVLRTWKKRCSILRQSTSTGRPIEDKVAYAGSKYSSVNKHVCKFINSRKGCNFPNYKDILKIVQNANKEDDLKLRNEEMEYEAKKVFQQVGKSLQNLRQADYRLCSGSHITDEARIRQSTDSETSNETESIPQSYPEDPALYNSDLKKRLQENKAIAEQKMESVIEDFVKRQEVKPELESESDEDGEVCSYSESEKTNESESGSTVGSDSKQNSVKEDEISEVCESDLNDLSSVEECNEGESDSNTLTKKSTKSSDSDNSESEKEVNFEPKIESNERLSVDVDSVSSASVKSEKCADKSKEHNHTDHDVCVSTSCQLPSTKLEANSIVDDAHHVTENSIKEEKNLFGNDNPHISHVTSQKSSAHKDESDDDLQIVSVFVNKGGTKRRCKDSIQVPAKFSRLNQTPSNLSNGQKNHIKSKDSNKKVNNHSMQPTLNSGLPMIDKYCSLDKVKSSNKSTQQYFSNKMNHSKSVCIPMDKRVKNPTHNVTCEVGNKVGGYVGKMNPKNVEVIEID